MQICYVVLKEELIVACCCIFNLFCILTVFIYLDASCFGWRKEPCIFFDTKSIKFNRKKRLCIRLYTSVTNSKIFKLCSVIFNKAVFSFEIIFHLKWVGVDIKTDFWHEKWLIPTDHFSYILWAHIAVC